VVDQATVSRWQRSWRWTDLPVLEGLGLEEKEVFPGRGEQLRVCGHNRVLATVGGRLQKMEKSATRRCCVWVAGSLPRTALLLLSSVRLASLWRREQLLSREAERGGGRWRGEGAAGFWFV
jgi:hypothetical protein